MEKQVLKEGSTGNTDTDKNNRCRLRQVDIHSTGMSWTMELEVMESQTTQRP